MKTTLELPEALIRRAQTVAAERGIPLQDLVTEALSDKLSASDKGVRPWMKSFGGLKTLRTESARLRRIVEKEFEVIEAEDRL